MPNTGKKKYNSLTEVYVDTGLSTGQSKPNLPTDQDYVAPIEDLVTCTPSGSTNTTVNTLSIIIENNGTQSIVLPNFLIRGESSVAEVYYHNQELRLHAGDNIVVIPSVIQRDDLSRIVFQVSQLSLGIRTKMTISYRKQMETQFTEVRMSNFVNTNTIDERLITTGRALGANSINHLKVTFTDNPIPAPPINVSPIAEAGVNQSATLPISTVTLTGSCTDPDGTIASTTWTQIAGPKTATIASPNGSVTLVSDLTIAGEYVFRLTATDNLGASHSDTVKAIIAAAPTNPNGLMSVYVDNQMPNTTFSITSIVLEDPADVVADLQLVTTAITKDTGVVMYNPPKGIRRMYITVAGAANNEYSLEVIWKGGVGRVEFNVPGPGVYAIENVEIDEGLEGTLVRYKSVPSLAPTFVIKYAKLTVDEPILNTYNALPNNFVQEYHGDIRVLFYNDSAGLVPILYTGDVNVEIKSTDLLTTTILQPVVPITITGSSNHLINTLQEVLIYTGVNGQGVLIEHVQYVDTLKPGQGYLIIP